MSSAAPKKKSFDRGSPVWPPRSNVTNDCLRGGSGGSWGAAPPAKTENFSKKRKKKKKFFFSILAGGRCPPLNGRSSHLIEAAKRGRLDQMIFFSAPLTTRAPPTTVRRPSDDRPPAVRQPSTVPMILRYLGANLRAGANFKNLPLPRSLSEALKIACRLILRGARCKTNLRGISPVLKGRSACIFFEMNLNSNLHDQIKFDFELNIEK